MPGAILPFLSIPYDPPSFHVVILLNYINLNHRGGGPTLGGRRAQGTFPRRDDVCRGLEGWDALVPIDQRGSGMYYVTLCMCRKRPLLNGHAGLSTIILSSRCILRSLSISDSLGGLSPFLYSPITAGQRQEDQPVHDDVQANGEHLPFSRRLPIARSPKL